MSAPSVSTERRGAVLVLTLDRAEARNALDRALLSDLRDAVGRVADDPEARALVLAAAGADFSVGADLGEMVEAGGPPSEGPGVAAIEALAALGIPTVAAIQGQAFGGGLELALACDLRLAAQDARLGLPEVRLGLLPSGGGTQRLPRIVGRAKALEMILLGEPIDAGEALRTGLVSRVVPNERLLDEALKIASGLAALGPIALRYGKEAVLRGTDMTFEQGLRLEMDLSVLLHSTADRAEGIRAFLEKRQPRFRGA